MDERAFVDDRIHVGGLRVAGDAGAPSALCCPERSYGQREDGKKGQPCAAKDHLITDTMSAWAHEVRIDANDQRHADKNAQLPAQEDAVKCVEFSLALAEYLFVLPARVRRGLQSAKSK